MLRQEEKENEEKEQSHKIVAVSGVAEGHEKCTIKSCSVDSLNSPLLSSIKEAQSPAKSKDFVPFLVISVISFCSG